MKYFIDQLSTELRSSITEQFGIPADDIVIEKANSKFDADLAVPLFRFGSKEVSPPELAKKVAQSITHEAVAQAEAVSGFVNLTLNPQRIAQSLLAIDSQDVSHYGDNELFKDQRIVVEYTDPNPFKELHIGHAYSNTVGESIARLLAAGGAAVSRVTYGGDVGLHVAKALWGIERLEEKEQLVFEDLAPHDRSGFLGRAYALGATQFEEDESAQAEIKELNKTIYAGSDERTNSRRELGKQWSYDYFDQMYERMGMRFDRHIVESEVADRGVEIVKEGLSKQVFEESDGAVVFRGEDHGLHTRVFLTGEGLPTYEAKELGLLFFKDQLFNADHSVIITGNEQVQYLDVVYKSLEQLYPEMAAKTTRLSHGIVKLPSGKMSSRTGDVVTARQLLDAVEQVLREANPEAPAIVENALGAFKYAMLKNSIGGDIVYDMEESLDVQGNSGPYVQYAAVRVGSILDKVGEVGADSTGYDWQAERQLLLLLAEYPVIVESAMSAYEPHQICNFVYELSREMNRYYEKVPVKDAPESERAARVQLLSFVQHVFRHALSLLNIPVPAKM